MVILNVARTAWWHPHQLHTVLLQESGFSLLHLPAVAGPADWALSVCLLRRSLCVRHVQGPAGWQVLEDTALQSTQEVLPQQLQDVLVLALATLPDPALHGASQMRKLAQLLELPATRQLSTQSVQSLVDVALKVCVLSLQIEPRLFDQHWHPRLTTWLHSVVYMKLLRLHTMVRQAQSLCAARNHKALDPDPETCSCVQPCCNAGAPCI
jgi:hypothetical protein